MATSSSNQPNDENSKPNDGEKTQPGVDGDGPPKTAKQLAKDAEKAEKLRKLAAKQEAKAKADEEVLFIVFKFL
jgi:hypothetical protein